MTTYTGNIRLLIWLGTTVLALTACGGGGSNGSASDDTPPTATVSPVDGTTGVERKVVIHANFNEDMFANTIDGARFSLSGSDQVAGTVSFDALTNVASFTPSTQLAMLTHYTAHLDSGITDLSGNALAAQSWGFTTRDGLWRTPESIETETGNGGGTQVAMNANGHAMAVWSQSNGTEYSVWANRYTPDGGWGTAELIETDTGNAGSAQVAMDANGNALAVWTQRGNVWANRYTANSGWGTGEVIETSSDRATSPHLATNANGDAVAVWGHYDSAYSGTRYNVWVNRYTPNSGWGTAELVELAAGNAIYQQVAIDANGNAMVIWSQGYNNGYSNDLMARRFLVDGSWGTAEVLTTSSLALSSQIAMNADGNALAVWTQFTGTGFRIQASRYTADGSWSTAEYIQDGGNAEGAQVAIDANGNALAVWVQSKGLLNNLWANRYTADTGWGTAVLIETDDTGNAEYPQVTVDARGNALAVWRQNNTIWANRYIADGNWGEAELIGTNFDKPPQVTMDANGNALAISSSDGSVWVNRFD